MALGRGEEESRYLPFRNFSPPGLFFLPLQMFFLQQATSSTLAYSSIHLSDPPSNSKILIFHANFLFIALSVAPSASLSGGLGR